MAHDVPTCWFVSGRDQGDELLPRLHRDSGRSEIKSPVKLYRPLCSSAPARRWPLKEEVVTEASRIKTSPTSSGTTSTPSSGRVAGAVRTPPETRWPQAASSSAVTGRCRTMHL